MKEKLNTAVCVAVGVILAVALLLAGGWYRTGRGYGADCEGVLLEPEQVLDYEQTEDGWKVTGSAPMILFQTEWELGHIGISLKQPQPEDTIVILYYKKEGQQVFDRFCRKERYIAKGSREAELTVPAVAGREFRLEIRGNFHPEELRIYPAQKEMITMNQVLGQINPLYAFVLCLFLPSGLLLLKAKRKEKKQKSEQSKTVSCRERQVYFDGLRVLAAALVIVVHVVEPVILMVPPQTKLHTLVAGISIGCLVCNLMFVMLSGALLIPFREEAIGTFIKKRLGSVVLPLMVYGFFYVRLMSISQMSLREWVQAYTGALISGTFTEAPHLWLVYELLALYLVVPLLRYMVKSMPEKLEKVCACMILAFLAVRTIFLYWNQPVGIQSFLGDWTGIFLLGYFVTRPWMRRYDRALAAGGCVAFLISVWTAMTRLDYKGLVCNQSILMTLMALAVFVAVLHMERWLKPFARPLAVGSRYCYSVLLIHWFVLNNFIYNGWLSSDYSAGVQVVVPILTCMAMSLLISIVVDHMVVAVIQAGLSRLAAGAKQTGAFPS